MLLSAARLRRSTPLLLALASAAAARDDVLYTSSVSYCAPPQELLVSTFNIVYFAKNQSVFFDIAAASVQPNVSVSANLLLNDYGSHPFNYTLQLCSYFGGALCPLPMYNFNGTDIIPLPASLDVSSRIPSIAYSVPDLEAYAQLMLVEEGTGNVVACLQATLSNGWSMHQVAVEWATAALGLLALLSALFYSFSTESLAPYRLFDLFYLYQWAASTGFLDLNYSLVYTAFTSNFSWAMGLIPASATSSLQNSINNMRHLTGGHMADASTGSSLAFTNREMSPYNAIVQETPVGGQSGATSLLVQNSLVNYAKSTMASFVSALDNVGSGAGEVQGNVQTVTPSSSNVLDAGIPTYTSTVGVAAANAFMTVFLVALIVFVIALAVLGLGYAVIFLLSRRSNSERLNEWKYRYPGFVRAWLLRIALIAFTPVTIFAFYQWTLKDSWLSVLLSVILLLVVLGYILYPAFSVVRLASRSTPYALYSQSNCLNAHGPLYSQYRPDRYFFTILLLIAMLVKSLFIAFAHANGEVQVIVILVVEIIVFACIVFFRPNKTRRADVLSSYLALTRVVCTGLLIAFVQKIGLAAIPRVAVGLVIAVIISIAVIVMFFNTLVNLGLLRPFRRGRKLTASDSDLEKRGGESVEGSQSPLTRPNNPVPQHDVPMDQSEMMEKSLPNSPQYSEPASDYSAASGSTTLGSVLPRRWSWQQSHSQGTSPSSNQFVSSPSSPNSNLGHSTRPPTIEEHMAT